MSAVHFVFAVGNLVRMKPDVSRPGCVQGPWKQADGRLHMHVLIAAGHASVVDYCAIRCLLVLGGMARLRLRRATDQHDHNRKNCTKSFHDLCYRGWFDANVEPSESDRFHQPPPTAWNKAAVSASLAALACIDAMRAICQVCCALSTDR